MAGTGKLEKTAKHPLPPKPWQPQHVDAKAVFGCCIQAHTWQEPHILHSKARSRLLQEHIINFQKA